MNEVTAIQQVSCWEITSSISMAVTTVLTGALVLIGQTQLKNLVKSNSLKTILDLESELYQRKSKIEEISSKIRVAGINKQEDLVVIYSDDLEAAKENYFNILDRLCYCILKGYLKDRDWKSEYLDLIKDTVRNNESNFGIGTYYKNIKKIYEEWNNI